MINLPRDFATARGYDGSSYPALTPGGHICRIRNVVPGNGNYGEQITVTYDIVEEGEFNGYFQKIFDYRSKQNPSGNANWPGVKWFNIYNDNGDTDGFFKGFIEAVEASNPGYKFTGDERGLQGKLVGFNFREEEYMPRNSNTGEIKTTVRPFYAVSVAKVREGIIPPAKKLYNGGSSGGYQRPAAQPGYSYPQSAPPAPGPVSAPGYSQDDDDDLPF